MHNEALIAETSRLLAALPEDKARRVRDFAAFLVEHLWATLPLVAAELVAGETEEEFARNLTVLTARSGSFDWLHDKPDLYTDEDLIERYI